jgi:hypothetical protein
MHENDISLIRTLILANGLEEFLQGAGKVCSDLALEIAPTNVGEANTYMHVSVSLDTIVEEIENDPALTPG